MFFVGLVDTERVVKERRKNVDSYEANLSLSLLMTMLRSSKRNISLWRGCGPCPENVKPSLVDKLTVFDDFYRKFFL